MRSPVRIWVAAPEKPRPSGRGFWFFWSCYSFDSKWLCRIFCDRIQFAYPDRRSTSLLVRRREWVSSPLVNTWDKASICTLLCAPEKPRPSGRGFWFFWSCCPIRTAFRRFATKSSIAARSDFIQTVPLYTIRSLICSLGKIPQAVCCIPAAERVVKRRESVRKQLSVVFP